MSAEASALVPGSVVWADLAPTRGREQAGHRPVLVVSSRRYLEAVTTLAVVVPLTTTDRRWPNHVPVDDVGLPSRSFAMTEQPRTIARERCGRVTGVVADATLADVRRWLVDFLED